MTVFNTKIDNLIELITLVTVPHFGEIMDKQILHFKISGSRV